MGPLKLKNVTAPSLFVYWSSSVMLRWLKVRIMMCAGFLCLILVFDETNFASVSLFLQLTSLGCILKECGRISSSIKDCIQSTICRSAHWTPHHVSTTHSAVLQPASVCVLPLLSDFFPRSLETVTAIRRGLAASFHPAERFASRSLLSHPRREW